MDVLTDDALASILGLVSEDVAYVAQVCSRFLRLCSSGLPKDCYRRTPVRRAFASTRRLEEAKANPSVMQRVWDHGLQRWNAVAERASFSDGPLDVIEVVMPSWANDERTLHYVCRYDRFDLLCAVKEQGSGLVASEIKRHVMNMSMPVDRMFNTTESRIRAENTVREFCKMVLVPSLLGGSLRIIQWFKAEIFGWKLRDSNLWSRAFEGASRKNAWTHLGALVCASACAQRASVLLDFVEKEVVAASRVAAHRVGKEIALIVMCSVGNGATREAIEWASARHESLCSLVALFNAPDETPSVCTEVYGIFSSRAAMFDVRSVGAYREVKRMTEPGGWMFEAFEELDMRTSFSAFVLNRCLERACLCNPPESQATLLECLRDCASEYALGLHGNNIVPVIRRGLTAVLHTSLLDAYSLLCATLSAGNALGERAESRIRRLICGEKDQESFLYCLLHGAVYLGLTRIVEGVLSKFRSSTFGPHGRRLLASVASAASSTSTAHALARNNIDFDVHCAKIAAKRGNSTILSMIMQNSSVATLEVGKAALQSRHLPTVKAALLAGCFDSSDARAEAERMLNENTPKRRRVLPRSFGDETSFVTEYEPQM